MKDIDGTPLKVGDIITRVQLPTTQTPIGYEVELIGIDRARIVDGSTIGVMPEQFWRKSWSKTLAVVPKEEIKSPIITKTVTTTSIEPGFYGRTYVGGLVAPQSWQREPLNHKVSVRIGSSGGTCHEFTTQDCLDAARTLVELAEYLKKLDSGNG